MTCDKAEELFSDYYDKALTGAEQLEVEEHLRGCANCGEEFRHFKRGLDLLRTSSQYETSSVFSSGVVSVAKTQVMPPGPSLSLRRAFPWSWMPAFAAVAVIAFLVGLLVRGGERVREVPPPLAERERMLREEYGLVNHAGHWMPREMKEGFEKGWVCLDGKMMPREEAFAKLSDGRTPEPDLDREMAKHGYDKVGRNYVKREWIEAWKRGSIQTGPDVWVTQSEFRTEVMRVYDLVEYPERSGILMSRTHRDELIAQRTIRRPDTATADNEATAALAGLEIGPPASHRNLTLYPILSAREQKEPGFLTLPAALEGGKIRLEEGATAFEVLATNGADRPVLLLEGEVLTGGRCARVVAGTSLVPAGGKAVVPVVCAEPEAYRGEASFSAESGHYFGAYGLRKILLGEAGQGAVWAQLARQIDLAGGKAKSQSDVYRQLVSALFEYRSNLVDLPERFPTAVGVVLCVGDTVEAVELFPDRAVFVTYFERVLNAAALEACLRQRDRAARGSRVPATPAGARRTIESVYFAKLEGRTLRIEGRPVGQAFETGGRLVRLVVWADPPPAEPEWRANYAVPADKLRGILDAVEARGKGGTLAERLRAIREISFFAAREATARLERFLADADLRREAIRAMGRREDPAGVPALLGLLEESRKDPATYAATAAALARIGDDRAVKVLLGHADAGAALVRVVLAVLTELLLQVRNAEVLETSMAWLLRLAEEAEAVVKGRAGRWPADDAAGILTVTRDVLEGLTGELFENAARAREWWNRRENRERFLSERTGK